MVSDFQQRACAMAQSLHIPAERILALEQDCPVHIKKGIGTDGTFTWEAFCYVCCLLKGLDPKDHPGIPLNDLSTKAPALPGRDG